MIRMLTLSFCRASALMLALGGTLALGCSGLDGAGPETLSFGRGALNVDPDLRVLPGTTQIVNKYASLLSDSSQGSIKLALSAADATALGLHAGDLIMLYQAQGATMSTSDDANYGQLTALGNAGGYELVRVASVDTVSGQVQIDPSCSLRNTYKAAGNAQVIRVPRYRTVTVEAAGAGGPRGLLSAKPWDGKTGGVLAFRADSVLLDGAIDVSGRGFRGGATTQDAATSNADQAQFVSTFSSVGGAKGESIVGNAADYDALGGKFGRGAPANGGGGGNDTDAGGGGGANAGDSTTYTGDGVMGQTAIFAAAWQKDPFFVAHNAFSTSSGGGRGGYTLSQTAQDPTQVEPGNTAWGASNRRERGGRGGHGLGQPRASWLFLGGGGGAGDQNSGQGGAGGAGGGIVHIAAKTITSTAGGCIFADGATGGQAGGDGGGGGGGGGTVFLETQKLTGVTVSAVGGFGGDSRFTEVPMRGPGGGGGGGVVAVTTDIAISPQLGGGKAGISTSATAALFPVNGATDGGDGILLKNQIQAGVISICLPVDLALSLMRTPKTVRVDVPIRYTATVSNSGPEDAENLKVDIAIPADVNIAREPSGTGWTCTRAATAYTCVLPQLGAGMTAAPLSYALAARSDTSEQIASSAQVLADNVEANMANNSATTTVDVDRSEIHGNGFSCSAAGMQSAIGGAWALWFLGGAGFGLRLLRRRRRTE